MKLFKWFKKNTDIEIEKPQYSEQHIFEKIETLNKEVKYLRQNYYEIDSNFKEISKKYTDMFDLLKNKEIGRFFEFANNILSIYEDKEYFNRYKFEFDDKHGELNKIFYENEILFDFNKSEMKELLQKNNDRYSANYFFQDIYFNLSWTIKQILSSRFHKYLNELIDEKIEAEKLENIKKECLDLDKALASTKEFFDKPKKSRKGKK